MSPLRPLGLCWEGTANPQSEASPARGSKFHYYCLQEQAAVTGREYGVMERWGGTGGQGNKPELHVHIISPSGGQVARPSFSDKASGGRGKPFCWRGGLDLGQFEGTGAKCSIGQAGLPRTAAQCSFNIVPLNPPLRDLQMLHFFAPCLAGAGSKNMNCLGVPEDSARNPRLHSSAMVFGGNPCLGTRKRASRGLSVMSRKPSTKVSQLSSGGVM